MSDALDIVEQMRGMSADHGPDGWPAVQMRDISALCAEITRLRALSAQPAAVPGWQPIETAPRDGTSIIVASDSGNVWCDVSWRKRPRAGARWEHFTLGALRFNPASWMPLPAAPQAPQQDNSRDERQEAPR